MLVVYRRISNYLTAQLLSAEWCTVVICPASYTLQNFTDWHFSDSRFFPHFQIWPETDQILYLESGSLVCVIKVGYRYRYILPAIIFADTDTDIFAPAYRLPIPIFLF